MLHSRVLGVPALLACAMAVGGCGEPLHVGTRAQYLLQPKADLDPLRLGRMVDIFRLLPEAAPYVPLRDAISRETRRPVEVFEGLNPYQLSYKLSQGRLHYAIVWGTDYPRIAEAGPDAFEPLAVSVFPDGGRTCRGLIVTEAQSKITTLDELKGKRFAFGPKGDPVLHVAAVAALKAGGVELKDLNLGSWGGMLPLQHRLEHHINEKETAKAVLIGVLDKADAGVVTERTYNAWPKTGGSAVLGTYSQDQFRVLGTTDAVPGPVVVASARLGAEAIDAMREFLIEELRDRPEVLKPMGWSAFAAFEPEPYQTQALKDMIAAVTPPPATQPAP